MSTGHGSYAGKPGSWRPASVPSTPGSTRSSTPDIADPPQDNLEALRSVPPLAINDLPWSSDPSRPTSVQRKHERASRIQPLWIFAGALAGLLAFEVMTSSDLSGDSPQGRLATLGRDAGTALIVGVLTIAFVCLVVWMSRHSDDLEPLLGTSSRTKVVVVRQQLNPRRTAMNVQRSIDRHEALGYTLLNRSDERGEFGGPHSVVLTFRRK